MNKLAIITTHPIQYYAPVFRLLQERGNITIKVFYTRGEAAEGGHDHGFGKNIAWDIPLLEGYSYKWVKNTSTKPGSHHFMGIVTPGLITDIKSWEPNAILVFGWAYHSHLHVLRYFKNKLPIYFRGDSTLLDDKPSVKLFLKKLFLKWVYSHVDHAFYTGTNNKAYFNKYGLNDGKLSFAPHAIDNERFAADRATEVAQLRNGLGIAAHNILLLFAGKLEDKKAPILLLNAFLHLNNPQVHLLFVGNGGLQGALHKLAANHPNVYFLAFQNQSYMPVIYQACNLFCLPSKGPGETWGLCINEAMAAQKAIIAADKCGCAIDLVTGENGVIVESGDEMALECAIKNLTSNSKLLSELGKRSGELIKNWSFEHIAMAIEEKLQTNNTDGK